MLSRRAFLLSSAAAVIAPAVPSVPPVATSSTMIGIDLSTAPDMLAFAVGTPGEFDWQHIVARSAEEAMRIWREDHGCNDEHEYDLEFRRVPAWDGLRNASPADWFRAGMGHCCVRCDSECCADVGARVVDEDVVCEECLTIADYALIAPDEAIEDLANDIACEGETEVEARLQANDLWWAVEGDIWSKACALARDDGQVAS